MAEAKRSATGANASESDDDADGPGILNLPRLRGGRSATPIPSAGALEPSLRSSASAKEIAPGIGSDGAPTTTPRIVATEDSSAADPASQEAASTAPPEQLAQVRELFRHLSITEKNLGLYPAYSKVVRASVEKLAEVATACLELTGPVRIQVTQKTFLWEETSVYVEDSRNRNLAFRVYKDGVREIVFLPEVAVEELSALATCLSAVRDADEEDDDFTTLFWESDSAHIQLQLADDYLSQDDLPDLPKKITRLDALKLQRFKVSKEEKTEFDQALASRQDDDGGDSSFELSEAESETLRELVRNESSYFPLFDFVDILLELMVRNRDPNAFEESVRMIRTIIAAVIEDLDFDRAAWLMRRLTHEAHPGFTPAQLEALRDMIATFNDKQTIALLETYLTENDRLPPDHSVFNFMKAFPASALEAFCSFLRFHNHVQGVSAVLIELGTGNAAALAAYLDDADPLVVRAMIGIILQADREGATEHLARALAHPNEEVRAHAAQSILDHADEKAAPLFVPLLRERSRRLITIALQFFAKFSCPEAYESLQTLTKSRLFGTLDGKRQRLCFVALLKSSYSRAMDFIGARVLRWIVSLGRLSHARKTAALLALGAIESEQSRSLLERFAARERSSLSSVARRSLRELDRRASAGTSATPAREVTHA